MTETPHSSVEGLTPSAVKRCRTGYGQLRQTLINGGFAAGDLLRIVNWPSVCKPAPCPCVKRWGGLVSEQALEAMPNRTVRVPLITRTEAG